jgi:hypothetical protein
LRLIRIKIFKFTNKNTLLSVIFRFVARVNSYAHEMCHSVVPSSIFKPMQRCLKPVAVTSRSLKKLEAIGTQGVTLHSYHCAWAQPAKLAGRPNDSRKRLLGVNWSNLHGHCLRPAVP